jgi:hypothetical protein
MPAISYKNAEIPFLTRKQCELASDDRIVQTQHLRKRFALLQ